SYKDAFPGELMASGRVIVEPYECKVREILAQ
ncbi:MAG: hypothetical protein K0R31_920, partial [Clostridiales bacterium]|nr:hypothetical protein [Clostridiales bacterium]